MGIRNSGEAIQVREKRFGYFPQRFRWHGQEYVVSKVERCWTVKRRRWGGRVEQHCFRVRCGEAVYDVSQDLIGNTWHIERARG